MLAAILQLIGALVIVGILYLGLRTLLTPKKKGTRK